MGPIELSNGDPAVAASRHGSGRLLGRSYSNMILSLSATTLYLTLYSTLIVEYYTHSYQYSSVDDLHSFPTMMILSCSIYGPSYGLTLGYPDRK